jgi:predicted DNA-binding transcriptional regulator YafY
VRDELVVVIDYTNHRGDRSTRRIIPDPDQPLWFGVTEFHPEYQWLLDAFDVDKGQDRTFAMKDIHSWTPEKP